ncbi:hypothetical protein [Blastococcus sp. SYSU D00813]
MENVLAVIGGIYVWSSLLIAAPFFWWKKTNRSMSPVERRLRALVMGFGWPYFLIRFFTNRSAAEQAEIDRQAAAQRIINGAGDVPEPRAPKPAAPGPQTPSARRGASAISNPFDTK